MPRVPNVGGSVLPQILGWIRGFVCANDVEFRVLVQVVFGQGVDVEF